MRLREIRKAKGRQQKELAEKIGTDEPMMSKFENYKCLPIPSMMRKLLKELGCSRVEEIYEPHEVYLQLASINATVAKEKKESDIYKLTATLPKGAKAIFDKALKPLGSRSITDWVTTARLKVCKTARVFRIRQVRKRILKQK